MSRGSWTFPLWMALLHGLVTRTLSFGLGLRFLVSLIWESQFPDLLQKRLPRLCLDHFQIINIIKDNSGQKELREVVVFVAIEESRPQQAVVRDAPNTDEVIGGGEEVRLVAFSC
jgi:hypothetical protein